APWLRKTFELARAKAACYRPDDPSAAYDALLDQYEPDASAEPLERVFGELRARLTPLIAEIAEAGPPPRGPLDGLTTPIPRQVELNRRVARQMGFDFDGGRLDVSTHP